MWETAILQEALNYLLALKAELVKFPEYQEHAKNLEKVIKAITEILDRSENKRKSKITLGTIVVAKIVLDCLKVLWEIAN